MSNLETVRQIYAAFGRGDISAFLEQLDQGVDWEYGSGSNEVPWLQPRRGREAAAGFFEALREVEIHRFVPKELLEGPDLVVALVDIEFTVQRTGRRVIEEDEAHVWRFNSRGKVERFRHCTDTLQNSDAWRG